MLYSGLGRTVFSGCVAGCVVVVVVVLPGLVVPFVDGAVVPVVLCPLPVLAPPFPG